MIFLLLAILLASFRALRTDESSSLFGQSIMPTPMIHADFGGEGSPSARVKFPAASSRRAQG